MVVVSLDASVHDAVQGAVIAERPNLKLISGEHRIDGPYRGTELRQARQYYDPRKIETLASSIKLYGLFSPVELVTLDAAKAEEYLHVWNRVWQTSYTLDDIPLGPSGLYEIVVTGHCRRRAGIALCEAGKPPKDWPIKIVDLTPIEALDRQLHENIHTLPEAWEDAECIYRMWRFAEETTGVAPSIAELARKAGRSESAVRGYLKFAEAPECVQDAVRTHSIPYGIGLLLGSAVSVGAITQMDCAEHWLPLGTLPGQTVEVFAKSMKDRIDQARLGQEDLFGDLDTQAVREAYENDRLAIVLPEMVRRLTENHRYFRVVLDLAVAGKLGRDGPSGIFSAASPARHLMDVISLLEQLLPHLKTALTQADHDRAEAVLAEVASVLPALIAV